MPIHRQIIDMGFLQFVRQAPDGPLFYESTDGQPVLSRARTTSTRIAQFLHTLGVVPEGVTPNHAWRYRFKTVGREDGISEQLSNAIVGHAARSAGDKYCTATLLAMSRAIDRFPAYDLGGPNE